MEPSQIQDKIICPKCNSSYCTPNYNHSTNEGFVLCRGCGYFKGRFMKRDEDGELIHKWKWFKKYPIWEELEIQNPFGVYTVIEGNNFYSGYLADEQDYNILLDNLEKNLKIKNNSIKYLGVSQFVGGQIINVPIYNKDNQMVWN